MNIQQAIQAVIEGRDLSREEMQAVMQQIMTGEATDSQIGGFLIGLRMKGETIDEITAAARVMRSLATRVQVDVPHLVDTCGTGGDGSKTFNVSTAGAIVAAAAGANVAKHGNRSGSSSSGSADVLEAAGVKLDLDAEHIAGCIREIGLGFMFAPLHHGAMKYAIGARREMAVRTIFNVLGPLTNPAGAPSQVIGVFSPKLVEPLARVLGQLGSKHVMVVHSADGLDEISIGAPTHVAEMKDGELNVYDIEPGRFGMSTGDVAALRVDSAVHSLEMIESAFADTPGPARDIIALNAGAAIYVAGVADTLEAGVEKALAVIADGAANAKLAALVAHTNQ